MVLAGTEQAGIGCRRQGLGCLSAGVGGPLTWILHLPGMGSLFVLLTRVGLDFSLSLGCLLTRSSFMSDSVHAVADTALSRGET